MNTQVTSPDVNTQKNDKAIQEIDTDKNSLVGLNSSNNDENEESQYLSTKAKKLQQKRAQLAQEMEIVDKALELEMKEAKQKKIDSINNILEKNDLYDFSPQIWKSKISEIKKILKS